MIQTSNLLTQNYLRMYQKMHQTYSFQKRNDNVVWMPNTNSKNEKKIQISHFKVNFSHAKNYFFKKKIN